MARLVTGILLAVTLLLTACSTGRAKDEFPDQGPGRDTSVGPDRGGPTADHGLPGSDTGVPAACQTQCTDQADWLCVLDPSTSVCVECLNNGHCAYNIGAAGGTCDAKTSLCTCSTNADCVGKVLGRICHAIDKVCSCKADTDCLSGRKCIGNFFGAKVCKPPCTSDADCKSQLFTIVCDPKTGCQECVTSSHCGPTSLGKSCQSGLCSCSSNADCAANANGKSCIKEASLCGCENDFDCPSGKACTGQYLGNKLCK